MAFLHFSDEERAFWNRIQECFDADARAKGVEPMRHVIVIDMADARRAYLTTPDDALAREKYSELGRKLGEAASRRIDELFLQAIKPT